jgi:hypothetical protein
MPEFLDRYGEFYYYNALDGHEAVAEQDRELLKQYARAIGLHEETQTKVVDMVYRGAPEQQAEYLAAGRIDPDEGRRKLADIAASHGLAQIVDELRR